jgi:hypothetical protein
MYRWYGADGMVQIGNPVAFSLVDKKGPVPNTYCGKFYRKGGSIYLE